MMVTVHLAAVVGLIALPLWGRGTTAVVDEVLPPRRNNERIGITQWIPHPSPIGDTKLLATCAFRQLPTKGKGNNISPLWWGGQISPYTVGATIGRPPTNVFA